MIPENKPSRKTEIIAPGGSFQSAVHAFACGADAVYTGLKNYSARARAYNLSRDELGRLVELAGTLGKKVYVAMNTVITDEELDDAIECLGFISLIGADGIIVHDPGLALLARSMFPALRVHASTQMTVHNSSGLDECKKLGVSRVILPRELSLEETERLRSLHPDIELEVFVHGALCYSFSGLCLASGLLLGRSGNRGECAQICRSWFETDNGPGYAFSMNDLALAEHVRLLTDAGIDGLKIEGRMKPPEYSGVASAYYRAILDGGSEGEILEWSGKLETVFSRKKTTGYFFDRSGDDLINFRYPGHRGVPVGEVTTVKETGFSVTSRTPLSLHDGLMFFHDAPPSEPYKFGIRQMRMNGRPVFHAAPGDTVEIECEKTPLPHSTIWRIYTEDTRLELERDPRIGGRSTQMYPQRKVRVDVVLELRTDRVVITTDRIKGSPTGDAPLSIRFEYPIEIDQAQSKKDFLPIIRTLFSESGESVFLVSVRSFINNSGMDDDGIFARPSLLKRLKNEFYRELEKQARDRTLLEGSRMIERLLVQTGSEGTAANITEGARINVAAPEVLAFAASAREKLSPKGNSGFPFIGDPASLVIDECASGGGYTFLPLPPLVFDPHDYLERLCAFIERHKDVHFAIGLNNISHLAWCTNLERLPGVYFFIDFFLYCANRAAFGFFRTIVPRLLFVYRWIESGENERGQFDSPILLRTGNDFEPPFFTSRACVFRHSLGSGCPECLDGASCNRETLVIQNKNRYRLVTRDHITYLFRQR